MKLRDVLLPKPFVGVVLWASVACVVTLCVLMPAPVQVVRAPPLPDTVIEVTAKPMASVIAASDTSATADELVRKRVWTDTMFTDDGPDFTHEVVTRTNRYLDAAGALHLGAVQPNADAEDSTSNAWFPIRVSKEDLDGGDLRIRVLRSNGFVFQDVELTTKRASHSVACVVRSGADTFPQPPFAWKDVSGEVQVSGWDWPRPHPLALEYSLYGVRGGRRHCAHARVAIDF